MRPPLRRAVELVMLPGSPLRLSNGEFLDLSAMRVEDARIHELDPGLFLQSLPAHLQEEFTACLRSADPLRDCHAFITRHSDSARAAAPPGSYTIHASDAVVQVYRRYLAREHPETPRLALAREDAVGPSARLAGAHLKGALSVAWRAAGYKGRLPLRCADLRLARGRIVARAVLAGRLRTDQRRPVTIARASDWFVAACPEQDALYTGTLGPVDLSPGAAWAGDLRAATMACNRHYRPRLATQIRLLAKVDAHAPGSLLAGFVHWARGALAATAEDPSCFVLQLGGLTGAGVHNGYTQGSEHRLPVCLEAPGRCAAGALHSARPLGWLLARVSEASA